MKLKPKQTLLIVHLLILALIVMPFLLWGEDFDQFAKEMLSGGRPGTVFAATVSLLALDVFIPVPSSAVSISAGMILGTPLAFVACFTGFTCACFIGYGFGYYFRKFHFNRWYGDAEFRQLSMQLSRYGYIVLLACRGIPILAELSVMVAGFHRFPLRVFIPVTMTGNLVLAGLYSYIGDTAQSLSSVYFLIAVLLLIPAITYSTRLWWLNKMGIN